MNAYRPLFLCVLVACGAPATDDKDPTDTVEDTTEDTEDTTDTVVDTDPGDTDPGDTDPVVVPDYDPDSSLGRALQARCDQGTTCGDDYSCSGPLWDSVDSCIANIFPLYSTYADSDLDAIATFLASSSCPTLFEGINGFCNNPDHIDSCTACPANPCTLTPPSDADLVVDLTAATPAWGRIASGFGGAHDYGIGLSMPELTAGQKVSVRFGFPDALVLDSGGLGQLVLDGLLTIAQSPGGPTHPYTFGTPTLEIGPDTSTVALATEDREASASLSSGRIECAMLTFTVEGLASGTPWPYPQLDLTWRNTGAVGTEPPGFEVDGSFTRP